MKNPLDSLWGTVISGLVLTLVLYLIVKNVLNTTGG
jgi:YbbR domain-containing protein